MKPGTVVRSVKYGVDFGEVTIKPGDVGIIISDDFSPGWFGVRWMKGYVCHIAPSDVVAVDEDEVWRIVSGLREGP